MNPATRTMLNKVPLVTLAFWIIKIMATTVGETGADFLIFNLGVGLTVTSLIAAVFMAAVLVLQLRQTRYVPWIYWVTVVLLSIVGTLVTDNLTDNFGISLYVSTALFAVALGVTFLLWYRSEHTLSIHDITTPRREGYYWAAILFTFALGTAAGDLLSEQMGLGYALAGAIFGAGIAVVAVGLFLRRAELGAGLLDRLCLDPPAGRLARRLPHPNAQGRRAGILDMTVSGIFLAVIVALVAYLTISGVDREPDRAVV